MKICLVTVFPPSRRNLSEYGFHIARQLQQMPGVELTVLADELTRYSFSTDREGHVSDAHLKQELPGFHVMRCWKFGSATACFRLLRAIRKVKPDVVWFNLVFTTFGARETPLAAFAGLAAPALVRAAGFYTHITLHHIMESVDFSAAGVKSERLFRLGTEAATRALLKANSVSVMLSSYQRTLATKYSAHNVLLSAHGTFSAVPSPPDFSLRGNPECRILAFGGWGTYKRLETLMEAFPAVLEKIPQARLIVAGANHHMKPGYWESVRDAQPAGLPIEFLGYIPEAEIPKLFRSASLLVLPYDSTTGSSGPAHQACEFGLPIVCADLEDFHRMAKDDRMAIRFYPRGDAAGLAERLVEVLQSPELQVSMGTANYAAGLEMNFETVMRNYLRWFELMKSKRGLAKSAALAPCTSLPPASIEPDQAGWERGGLPQAAGSPSGDAMESFAMVDSNVKGRTA